MRLPPIPTGSTRHVLLNIKVTQFTLHQTYLSSKSLQLTTRSVLSLASPVLFQALGLVAYQSYLTVIFKLAESGGFEPRPLA